MNERIKELAEQSTLIILIITAVVFHSVAFTLAYLGLLK